MPRRPAKAESGTQAAEIERDLSAIRRMMRKPLEAEVSKGNLTVPQKAAMAVVVRHEGISLKGLSTAMSLAHSTVSGIVDRLEKQGLVERRTDASDGRISRIHAAAVVKDFVREKIPELSRGPLSAALDRASAQERSQIAAAMRRLRELLEAAQL
ncbi:MAG TPA: MarR family transcriptional regulator [Terracidiphilus sp.]|nr:MarR family transcriptional regulator [Terracidiphilus sp.]